MSSKDQLLYMEVDKNYDTKTKTRSEVFGIDYDVEKCIREGDIYDV